MSLCHDCLMDYDDQGTMYYTGSSPDEVALVDAARHIGYKFI